MKNLKPALSVLWLIASASAAAPSLGYPVAQATSAQGKEITVDFGEFVSPRTKAALICSDQASPLVSARLWMDMGGHGHGSTPTRIAEAEGGCFAVTALNFVMSGPWEIQLSYQDGDKAAVKFHVNAEVKAVPVAAGEILLAFPEETSGAEQTISVCTDFDPEAVTAVLLPSQDEASDNMPDNHGGHHSHSGHDDLSPHADPDGHAGHPASSRLPGLPLTVIAGEGGCFAIEGVKLPSAAAWSLQLAFGTGDIAYVRL